MDSSTFRTLQRGKQSVQSCKVAAQKRPLLPKRLWLVEPRPIQQAKKPKRYRTDGPPSPFELGIFGQTIGHGIFVYMQKLSMAFLTSVEIQPQGMEKNAFSLNSKKILWRLVRL